MTGLGFSWSRLVVTKLELGRRETVSVDEAIALAALFGLPPMTLIEGGAIVVTL